MTISGDDKNAVSTAIPAWHRHRHRLGPSLMLALSLIFWLSAAGLVTGSASRPGPGFWPLLVASVTGALSLVAIFSKRTDEEALQPSALIRVALLLAAMLSFPFLMEIAGFFIPSFLLIVFMMRGLSHQPLMRSLIVAAATSGAAYVIFGFLLNVRLTLLPF